jgi:CHC2 zinc finger/Toprim-like
MIMGNKRLSFIEAKQVSIVDYLSSLGIEPVKVYGNDHWYRSPFREERTPSFKVNARLNVWFDHGTGEGGTIIDLAAKLHQCTYQEATEKLTNGNFQKAQTSVISKKIVQPENKIEIIGANPITDPRLIKYLKQRCIGLELANRYCREIDFSIGSKIYTAIGFPNQSNAYELRNRWFKGSSSPKDFSFIDNGEKKICVMEGFMDFLSVLSFDGGEIKQHSSNSNFLVLNSLRLVNRSLPLLQSHTEINLFLDNDPAAQQAKEILKEKGIRFYDASSLYQGHKDVNEYLITSSKTKHNQTMPRKRPKGMRR